MTALKLVKDDKVEEMEEITNTVEIDLRKAVREYLAKFKLTIEEFATSKLGYERSTVSHWLSGDYKAKNPTRLERSILDFLRAEGELPECKKLDSNTAISGIHLTRDARTVLGVCQSCQENAELGIIVGKTGHGKSHVLKHYAKLPNVAYVPCMSKMSPRDMVYAIEQVIGISHGSGSVYQRCFAIRNFFHKNKGFLLIMDEADKLIIRNDYEKLELIRYIFDETKVGIVLSGEEGLGVLIENYVDRFDNRLSCSLPLVGLSREEAKSYLSNYNFEPDALEEMIKIGTNEDKGCFRRLAMTLKNVLRELQSPDELITKEIIRKASSKRQI